MIYATYLLADLFPLGLLLAAVSDIRTMTIPNKLCLGLALAFFPAALFAHLSLAQWLECLSMGGIGFCLGVALFALRLMGGGDAKLIAAASLWLGLNGFIAFIVYTALFGGVLTLGLLVVRSLVRDYALNVGEWPRWIARHLDAKGDIPYGVAICLGGIFAISKGPMASLFVVG